MKPVMSLRAPAKMPVAAAASFDLVGWVSRSFCVGWLVLVMSNPPHAPTEMMAPSAMATTRAGVPRCTMRVMVRTPP